MLVGTARYRSFFYDRRIYSQVKLLVEIISQRCHLMSSMANCEKRLRALFRGADAVCFDVDSTVCQDEAIDELAKFAGREREVEEIELVKLLHQHGVHVYLVSGGFQTIIEPVARELDIPMKNIFANRLKFYFNGDYAGFDENQPTSRQDGKAQVVKYLKQYYGYQRLVMVGDGATDLAACPPADGFIGFGGNQVREKVKQESKWFAGCFSELIDELKKN
ncbi:phosphoserine phosphatase-like isoform X3 [Limulus polyphemus]|uniref:Phosphoserine phosphatase n=1 Tax=Limulus polyphemus TaxID=6850 RepID=A0ABM1TS10_LIMPO|nr:phosphoserine phosphatase-like isoform X3 [Limulus polyphemus]